MLKIGVLVSGGGTNLQSVIDAIESGYIPNSEIVTVVSSKKDAYALERAKKHGITREYISRKDFETQKDYDCALVDNMKKHGVQLVLLCGFLSILGEFFIKEFEGRIINIHPALIPSFCGKGYYGLKVHEQALNYGVKITGATVHFVELEPDAGPIILQKAVEIKEDDTPETLQKRVMEEAEWVLMPLAVKLYAENRLEIVDKRVRIKKKE
ncbi:MAG: phosphoribosylglycinamide formyltransferase [Ignavibacteriales bacterium]